MESVRITLVVLALTALAAACSTEEDAPPALPSSQFPVETSGTTAGTGPSAPTGSTASGATGTLPTTAPGAATGNLTDGEVTFRVQGDVAAEATLRQLVSAIYSPPPGGLAIVWTAGGTDASTIGIGGASFTGTQPTSTILSLSITIQTPEGISSFLSLSGECAVAIPVASARELTGSFECRDLGSATGEVVDVSASFSATG